MTAPKSGERLLTATEVAALFRVGYETVGDWARAGKLAFVTTPGGRRRYPEAGVTALLSAAGDDAGGPQ